MGKSCRVFCRDGLPASLDVLKDETREFVFGLINPEEEGVIPEKTAAIAVDCADAGRMGEYAALFEKCAFRFVIDHHKTNAGFGDISFIRPYPATAQLIMELADELGARLDANTAKCLYVAFLTDTGRFAYSGVTEQTMRAAGRLYGFGIDTADIARQLFSVRTLSKTKLLGRALELLDQVVRDGRDLKVFLHDLTQHMRSLLLTKLCGHCSDILDCTEDSMKRYEEQAKEAGETRLLRCSELLLQAEGRLRTVTMPRALIESTLVRISRPEEKRTMDDLMERIEVLERQVREGAPRCTAIAEPIPIGEKPDADEYPCDYGFEEPPEPEDVPPFDIDEPIRTAPASKPEKPSPAHPAKPAETAGSMSPQKLWKAILDKLGETERTMAVSGMYGKGSAINGNVLEVAFESEIIYRMMSAPGALEKVNGAADKVAPGYTVRMTQKSGGDDIESTGRALFGSNFRIEN